MKKFIFLLICIFLSIITIAQINTIQQINEDASTELNEINWDFSSKSNDTINLYGFFNAGGPSLGSINGLHGWMFGTSWWGVDTIASRACAQGFIYNSSTPYFLVEVLIWAHSKYADSTGSSLLVTINALDDSSHYGNSTTNWDIVCPGTVLGSASVPFNSIDTGLSVTFTNAMISPPIFINNNFAIVVDVSDFYLHHDTVGFVAGATGSASNLMGLQYTWWKYHNAYSVNDFWAQLSHIFTTSGGPADHAIAFWPVIDVSTGIDSPILLMD